VLEDEDSEIEYSEEAERVEPTVSVDTWNFAYIKLGTEFRDKDGTRGWELGNKRRMTIQTFKGKQYVGIREYYEKDGKVSFIVSSGLC
jgi:hypothetical protein